MTEIQIKVEETAEILFLRHFDQTLWNQRIFFPNNTWA